MLLGKTIIVTGVSSGIGQRTAELAIAQGADVIGLDMVEPSLNISSFIKMDISNQASIDEAVDRMPKNIDALCNVAGVSGTIGAEKTLAINFYGLRALSEAVAPRIRQGGSIVNVASIAGIGWRANLERAKALVAVDGMADIAKAITDNDIKDEECYPVSKEALLLWNLKAAHQPLFKDNGIRVNAASPGPVETPILTQFRSVLGDEKVDSDIARVGRAGNSGDIAPIVLFLCSDGARWINGTNVGVDGGLEASVLADILEF